MENIQNEEPVLTEWEELALLRKQYQETINMVIERMKKRQPEAFKNAMVHGMFRVDYPQV